jgi:hypothetical protein
MFWVQYFTHFVYSIPILVTSLLIEIAITVYAPMIYTAPCIMFWMRAYPLQGQVGGGWAPEFERFLGPV